MSDITLPIKEVDMRIKLFWTDCPERGETEEVCEVNGDDAQVEGERLVKYFNDTLRPGELPRKLIRVEKLDESDQQHKWEKISITTQIYRGKMYDKMKCQVCGITGKRFGIGGGVKIDSKYRAYGFRRCDKAQEILQKRAERKQVARL